MKNGVSGLQWRHLGGKPPVEETPDTGAPWAPVSLPWELLIPLQLRFGTVGEHQGSCGKRSSGGGPEGGSQHHGQGLATTFSALVSSPSTQPDSVPAFP